MTSFCVLNASFPLDVNKELDEYVDFRQGLDSCFEGEKMVKKTISWHSLAAAHDSEFFVYKKSGWEGCLKYDNVLVLVREHFDHVVPLIKKLKMMKKKVGIAYHENAFQFANESQNLNHVLQFKSLCNEADYYWNINDSISEFLKSILNIPILTSVHAYPYEWASQFKSDQSSRDGIILGSRTLGQFLNRYTLYTIGIANKFCKENNTFATYVNCDNVENKFIQDFFDKAGFDKINIIKGPLEYADWLRLISKHKVLFHSDNSETLGQPVADAISVDVPACGGNTTFERFYESGTNLKNASVKLKTYFNIPNFKQEEFKHFKQRTSYSFIKDEMEKFFEINLK